MLKLYNDGHIMWQTSAKCSVYCEAHAFYGIEWMDKCLFQQNTGNGPQVKSDNGSLRSAQGPVEQKERQSSRNVCTFKGKTYTHTKRNRKDKAEETCTFKGKTPTPSAKWQNQKGWTFMLVKTMKIRKQWKQKRRNGHSTAWKECNFIGHVSTVEFAKVTCAYS